jgi:copper chaperone CopZ
MKTYKFKTNINCNGCIKAVSPFLNQLEATEWEVDIQDKRKVLEVRSDKVDREDIIGKVKEAGYEIEPLKEGLWNKLFH